jgi:hypothetical protein
MSANATQLQVLLTLATDLKDIFHKSSNGNSIVSGVFGCMETTMSLAQKTIKVQIEQQKEIDSLKKSVEELTRLSAPDYKKPLFDKPRN